LSFFSSAGAGEPMFRTGGDPAELKSLGGDPALDEPGLLPLHDSSIHERCTVLGGRDAPEEVAPSCGSGGGDSLRKLFGIPFFARASLRLFRCSIVMVFTLLSRDVESSATVADEAAGTTLLFLSKTTSEASCDDPGIMSDAIRDACGGVGDFGDVDGGDRSAEE